MRTLALAGTFTLLGALLQNLTQRFDYARIKRTVEHWTMTGMAGTYHMSKCDCDSKTLPQWSSSSTDGEANNYISNS